ncbi:hypothetical protein ACFLT1_00515 [Bacteroidota bacterium]
MKRLIVFVFFLSMLVNCYPQAQEMYMTYLYGEIYEHTRKELHISQELVNGKYHDYIYSHAIGHPFFAENEFVKSTITYRNTEYADQLIKYNIFDQSLVIKPSIDSSSREVLLPIEYVNSFTFNGLFFKKYSLKNEAPSYFQVIAETENLSCLYRWYKNREESSHMVSFLSYKFSNPIVRKYLLFDGEAHRYRNTRKFINPFPEYVHKALRTYIKSNKFNLKKISDQKMLQLMNYCQTVIEQEKDRIE